MGRRGSHQKKIIYQQLTVQVVTPLSMHCGHNPCETPNHGMVVDISHQKNLIFKIYESERWDSNNFMLRMGRPKKWKQIVKNQIKIRSMDWKNKKLCVTGIFVPGKHFLRRKNQGFSGGKGIKPSLIKKQEQSVVVLFKAHLLKKNSCSVAVVKRKLVWRFYFSCTQHTHKDSKWGKEPKVLATFGLPFPS